MTDTEEKKKPDNSPAAAWFAPRRSQRPSPIRLAGAEWQMGLRAGKSGQGSSGRIVPVGIAILKPVRTRQSPLPHAFKFARRDGRFSSAAIPDRPEWVSGFGIAGAVAVGIVLKA